MKAATKKMTWILSVALASCVALTLGVSGIFASAATQQENSTLSSSGRYYSDYSSKDEAFAATEEINVEMAEEGIVLLKNDDSLPLDKSSKISVFGVAQDTLNETTGSVSESLKDAGFNVNPKLEEYYLNDGATASSYGTEPTLGTQEKQSVALYNDVGVIVIGRGSASESSARSTNSGEEDSNTYLGSDTGWTHEAHDKVDETEYKHELQLTESEEELIKYVEGTCKKVVFMYTASYVFETINLENDDNINAIMWIGRLGNGGIKAVGEILSGDVNPSGKVVDEWTRDLTNDPTYANTFDTSYAGTSYSGVDYEEDIYMGYKFYETYWAEASRTAPDTIDGVSAPTPTISGQTVSADVWYDYNVVYPFGYGLSYTDFSYELKSLKDDAGTEIANGTALGGIYTSSSQDGIKSLTASVRVTNTGNVSGKETVQLYVEAPYTGTIEKPFITLAGYAKTGMLRPGQSETVKVTFNLQDIASYDYADANEDGSTGYTLEEGTYTVHIMESSSHENMVDTNPVYASTTFTLSGDVIMDLDDYSGNTVENWFSGSDETVDGDEWKDEYDSMLVGKNAGSMTLMSRSDFDGTKPEAPEATVTITGTVTDLIDKYYQMDADSPTWDDEDEPWYVSDLTDMAGWTQGTGVIGNDGMYDITLDDMAGISLYGSDGKINSQWTTFMNQLTWDEICKIVNSGMHITESLPSIGKVQTVDDNGPNYVFNGTTLVGAPTRAATWNTDLAYQCGIMVGNNALWQGMTGWYGPGINTHRNAFNGRNPEYFSSDSIQGGEIAAAIVAGAQSRGINVYVKHLALYDAGTTNTGCVNISEQNIRENYLKIFQMCMQEGGASACMSSFNRIGAIYAGQNYAMIQGLVRTEWGWNGFIVTDITVSSSSMDGLIRAGADIPDGDYSGTSAKGVSGTWTESYDWANDTTYGTSATTLSSSAPVGAVILDGTASPTQWYCARMSCMRVLYNEANSAGNNNGITIGLDGSSYVVEANIAQAVEVASGTTAVVPAELLDSMSGYSITSFEVTGGSLPEGVYIENGYLAGTALDEGEFEAELNVYVDGWIPISITLRLSVASAFEMEKDISTLETGESVDVYLFYDDTLDAFDSTYEYTFTVASGELPVGLSISSNTGRIVGTPTATGTYTFTVAVEVLDPNGWVLELNNSTAETYYAMIKMMMPDLKTDSDFVNWVINDGTLMGMNVQSTFDGCYWPADSTTYYFTYTISVVQGSGSTAESEKVVSNIAYSDGTLTVTYSDGTTTTIAMGSGSTGEAGEQGAAGSDGRGIASMTINEKGELVVTYTDGTEDNLGVVVGADGSDGSGCGSAIELAGTAIIMAVVLAAAAAVYAVSRKRRNSSKD